MRFTIQKSDKLELLIKGCQKGDAGAQRTLYDTYHKRMFTLCKRYLIDNFEAEDAMINGFIKVYDHIKRFEGAGSFEGWMKRIMVNEALGLLRKKKVMQVELEQVEHSAELSIDSAYDQMAAEALMQMVEELPIGYRTIFNLYAIEGYSHKEIADMLQISEGTSKSQLSRARQLLQQRLSKTYKMDTDTKGIAT